MDMAFDMIGPLLIVNIATFICYKNLRSPQIVSENIFEPVQGIININIYKGSNSQSISVEGSSNPSGIIRKLFTTEELSSKKVIFVFNGRRLNNNKSFGSQGVKNGSFLHSQIVNVSEREAVYEVPSIFIFLIMCIIGILMLWVLYFKYPSYFSFISKLFLVGFTELLCVFLYNNRKT